MRRLICLGVLAACGDDGSTVRADASVDAVPICNEEAFYIQQPITVSAPTGSVDGLKYMYAGRLDGFCGGTYVVVFANRPHHCRETDPTLTLFVRHPGYEEPVPVAGDMLVAQVSYDAPGEREQRLEDASFVVTAMDSPHDPAAPGRIAGSFRAQKDGWAFEITVDTVAQYFDNCI